MTKVKINNIEFFEEGYQEVAFSVYENGKLVEQNVAITQLPLSAESIHMIDDQETELAQIVAELASESKLWKEYDSDEARILRAIDRDSLTEIHNEHYTLNACFDNNISLKAFFTEYKEVVIASIDSYDRQEEIEYRVFDSIEDYEDFLKAVIRKNTLHVGSCSSAYSLATALGFTKNTSKVGVNIAK